jgi:phosphatidylinositol dimannoside acyltransferase
LFIIKVKLLKQGLLTNITNSRLGTAFGLGLSQALPPRLGYPFAKWLADRFSNRSHQMAVRAVRANQWIVHDMRISSQLLDVTVKDTFRNTSRSLFEFWHFYNEPQNVIDLVEFEPNFLEFIQQSKRRESAMLLVCSHMGNFDLVGRAAVLHGLDLHVLSFPQPPGGYQWQNQLRQIPGLTITPLSIEALHLASETLRANKAVLTGIDRPLATSGNAKYRLCFFDRPAAMPVFHIRLALKHNLPIIVVSVIRKADSRYHVWASDPIPMIHNRNLVDETVQNAEAVLKVIARNIRLAPDQWAMFYPVWPEIIDQVPG